MRPPPIQATASQAQQPPQQQQQSQQYEVGKQQSQQLQPLRQLYPKITTEITAVHQQNPQFIQQQHQQQTQQQQHQQLQHKPFINKSSNKSHDILIENQLNASCNQTQNSQKDLTSRAKKLPVNSTCKSLALSSSKATIAIKSPATATNTACNNITNTTRNNTLTAKTNNTVNVTTLARSYRTIGCTQLENRQQSHANNADDSSANIKLNDDKFGDNRININDDDDEDDIDNVDNEQSGNYVVEDSIQLVDLSTSPPSPLKSIFPSASFLLTKNNLATKARHQSSLASKGPLIEPAAVFSQQQQQQLKRSSQFSQSSSLSSDDGSLSAGEHSYQQSCSRASSFDDAAENFIINFPIDSTLGANTSIYNQNDCIVNLPLSETEPLLNNIEVHVKDKKRSICLNKNSASLIFTKKELPQASPISDSSEWHFFPTLTANQQATNNNCTKKLLRSVTRAHSLSNQQLTKPLHHQFKVTPSLSFTAIPSVPSLLVQSDSGGNNISKRRPTKHLPATFGCESSFRDSQLSCSNNNNLNTSLACFPKNNNHCLPAAPNHTTSPVRPSIHRQHSAACALTQSPTSQSAPISSTVTSSKTTTATVTRKQHAYSWYAPVYSALEEELEQDSRDSSPIHNLANTKKPHLPLNYQQRRSGQKLAGEVAASAVTDNETATLLDTSSRIKIRAQLQVDTASKASNTADFGAEEKTGKQAPTRKSSARNIDRSAQRQNSLSLPLASSISAISGISNSSETNSSGNNCAAEGPHAGSLGLAGGPMPKKKRLENLEKFFKSLVGLRPSASSNNNGRINSGVGSGGGANSTGFSSSSANGSVNSNELPASSKIDASSKRPASPEITITRTPSEQRILYDPEPTNLTQPRYRLRSSSDKLARSQISIQGSTSSLNVVQQKLRNIMRREGSASSLHQPSQSVVQYSGLRKCETVLAISSRRNAQSLYSPVFNAVSGLPGGSNADFNVKDTLGLSGATMRHMGSGIFSASGVEQIRPLNRLRNSAASINNGNTCSRCSSLLSLAASGSRYSLNITANGSASGFVNKTASNGVGTARDGNGNGNGGFRGFSESMHQLPLNTVERVHQQQQQQQLNHYQHLTSNNSISNSANLNYIKRINNQNDGAETLRDDDDRGIELGQAGIDANALKKRKSSGSDSCFQKSSTTANSSSSGSGSCVLSTSNSLSPPALSSLTTSTFDSGLTTMTPTSKVSPISSFSKAFEPSSSSASSTTTTPTNSPTAHLTIITTTSATHLPNNLHQLSSTELSAPNCINAITAMNVTGASSLTTSPDSTSSTLISKFYTTPSAKELRDLVDGKTSSTLTTVPETDATNNDTVATTFRPLSTSSSNCALSTSQSFQKFTCKLCLIDVDTSDEATTLQHCGCRFCTECMRAYVEFEISEGAYEISCPDAQCPAQGVMSLTEIGNLTTTNLMKKHHRYRLNREIELDKSRTWCPRAGCETVCLVGSNIAQASNEVVIASTSSAASGASNSSPSNNSNECDDPTGAPCSVLCPSCKDEFCSACKKAWHPNLSCEENSRRLVADGQDDIGIPFDNDLIKCCPMCAVPIEKDEGCAQMMCKRCKHVFCWYCLASLDDDFLLRHYDKGPCKNKLGHSRASVVWHRAQVIGIFAGFGILLLVASPLLLLAAPCIICCKCRSCSGAKIDEGDTEVEEVTALQS